MVHKPVFIPLLKKYIDMHAYAHSCATNEVLFFVEDFTQAIVFAWIYTAFVY